jgi:GT2 family glycosyltransferase
MQSMMAAIAYAASHGITISHVGVTQREIIDHARNNLTESFLGTSAEWLFWMDSDMIFPKETLVELLRVADEKNAKMVSGVYYQRKGENLPVLWSRGDELETGEISGEGNKKSDKNKYVGAFMFPHPDKQEAFTAHAAGYGCVLVHRSVFEVMDRPWFKFLPGTCSEDFYFFVNAKEMGFTLWVTPRLKLGHMGDPPIVTKDDFVRKYEKSNLAVNPVKTFTNGRKQNEDAQ